MDESKRAQRSKKDDKAKPQAQTDGLVKVTHENAPGVHALLLQQNRDWNIRNNRLLREIAYYLRCMAEGELPTDDGALKAVNAPPEKV